VKQAKTETDPETTTSTTTTTTTAESHPTIEVQENPEPAEMVEANLTKETETPVIDGIPDSDQKLIENDKLYTARSKDRQQLIADEET
jgi:hypothetical protein